MHERPYLRIIQGGRRDLLRLAGVEIRTAPPHRPPFAVDAVVLEEDTYRVLGASRAFRTPALDPIRVLDDASRAAPARLGTILPAGGQPRRLLAVVHDLDAEPSCTEASVRSALEALFHLAGSRDIRRIAVPLLGTVHGRVPRTRAAALLGQVIVSVAPRYPRRLWVVVPPGLESQVISDLERGGAAASSSPLPA